MHLVDTDVRTSTLHHTRAATHAHAGRASAFPIARLVLPLLLLALTAVPQRISAQGMGGGMGGMGGGGGRGGRGGRGRSDGESPAQHGPSGDDVARQMQALASLDQALRDVPNLDRGQKDSLKAIEGRYGRIFESYGIAARNKVDSARAAGGAMDMEDLSALRTAADSVRTGEFVLARAVLTTDEQRARFDGNVTDIQAEVEKRQSGTRGSRRARGAGRDSP